MVVTVIVASQLTVRTTQQMCEHPNIKPKLTKTVAVAVTNDRRTQQAVL